MERDRLPLAEIAVTLAGLAALALVVVLVEPLRDSVSALIQGDHEEVRNQIDELGFWGPVLILGLAVLHAIVFYPAEIVDAAAGFAYGFFPALVLVMFGWLLNGIVCWAIGQSVARPLFDRW